MGTGDISGKTVIRSGFGLYSGQGALDDLTAPNDNTGTRYVLSSVNAPGLTFPFDSFITQANHTRLRPKHCSATVAMARWRNGASKYKVNSPADLF
jgi:hypothetical protein